MSPPSQDDGCPKCGHTETDTSTMSATGSGISRMLDVQTNQFTTVTCTNCGYTELYRDVGDTAGDLVDLFFG